MPGWVLSCNDGSLNYVLNDIYESVYSVQRIHYEDILDLELQ